MSELETFLMTALKQIVDLHDDGNGAICKCSQCKLARQSLEAAQPALALDAPQVAIESDKSGAAHQ